MSIRSNILIILVSLGTIFLFQNCDYTPYNQGKILYEIQCAGCHGIDGSGFLELYPPVLNSDHFQADPYKTACYIRYGIHEDMVVNGKIYNQPMLAMTNLSEVEIANILNYVASKWNPTVEVPMRVDSIKSRIESCKDWEKVN